MPTKGVHKNIFDDISCRIRYLERRVFNLENKKSRIIPIYDKDYLPRNMPEGLLFFAQDSKQFGLVQGGNINYANTVQVPL